MSCGGTQDGRVMVEGSDRMWSTGEGTGKPLQYSYLENSMNRMRRQKDRTLIDDLPRSVVVAAAAAKLLQSCLTLCDPIHSSPPRSTLPGFLQARTLEWVAISFSKA